MTCTFFGHRDITKEIEPTLQSALIDLIENYGVDFFFVGDSGAFDRMVRRMLKGLAKEYPVRYQVVLAYMPGEKDELDTQDYSDTLLPEGIETVPRRFAISYRNRWMLGQSDFVVTHVTHSWGGAAQFKELAEKQGKVVINLG